jgi:hypothetical protein
MSHAAYAVVSERRPVSSVSVRAAAGQLVAAVLVAPWAVVVWRDWSGPAAWGSWAAASISLPSWVAKVLFGISRVFVDPHPLPRVSMAAFAVVGGIALTAAAICAAVGLRQAPRRARWIVVAVWLGCWAPLVAADAVSRSFRATVIRYQFPSILALQLCVAVGAAYLLTSREVNRRRLGAAAVAVLTVCGLASGVLHARADNWWNKYGADAVLEVAARTGESDNPLVLASIVAARGRGNALALAHALSEGARVQYFQEPHTPRVSAEGGDVFAWRLTTGSLDRLAASGWRIEPSGTKDLHRLK